MIGRPPGHGPASTVIGALVDRDAVQPVRLPRRKLRKLLPYFRPYLGRTLLTVVAMVVVAAAGLAAPALAQIGIDDGIQGKDKGVLFLAVGLLVVAGLVGWAAGSAQSYLAS